MLKAVAQIQVSLKIVLATVEKPNIILYSVYCSTHSVLSYECTNKCSMCQTISYDFEKKTTEKRNNLFIAVWARQRGQDSEKTVRRHYETSQKLGPHCS